MNNYRDDPLVKGAVCALEQQIADTVEFVTRAEATLANLPFGDCARARTIEWLDEVAVDAPQTAEAIKGILDEGVLAIARLLTSALDHAYGLRALLTDPRGLLSSPYGTARALLEAVLQACFILDPWIPPNDRVLRMLAYRVATVEGQLSTLDAFGKAADQTSRARITSAIEGLHGWLDRYGFGRDPEKRSVLATRRIGYRGRWVALEFNVTAAATKYMPNDSFFYAVLSGAAHGRGWFLAGHYGLDGGETGASRADVATSSALLTLSLSDALVEVLGRHVGVAYESVLRKTHRRRVMLSALPGTGPSLSVSFEDYHARAL